MAPNLRRAGRRPDCALRAPAWDSKAQRSRSIGVVVKRVAVLTTVGLLATALTGSARPAEGRLTFTGNCGPVLCIPLARGWSGSVGTGVVDRHRAAWLLAGNFPLPAIAAGHEGTPSVPPGKVLISIGDFPIVSAFVHWPRVPRLPRLVAAKRVVSWHVRFAGRAVFLSVRFGSRPDRQIRSLANARLSAIHRRR